MREQQPDHDRQRQKFAAVLRDPEPIVPWFALTRECKASTATVLAAALVVDRRDRLYLCWAVLFGYLLARRCAPGAIQDSLQMKPVQLDEGGVDPPRPGKPSAVEHQAGSKFPDSRTVAARRGWPMTAALPAVSLLFALGPAPSTDVAGSTPATPGCVLEIRAYNLKAGTREKFHELFVREALPLLQKWKVDVVAYGPSLHDRDSYFLMRAFSSVDDRARSEDAFYGSAEWREGPRAAVLAAIESYTTLVIRVDTDTLGGLRRTMQTHTAPSDLETLVRLNDDYIESVKKSDVARFREILADDFLCTLPDGTLIDREQFLVNTAKPYTLGNLQAHDVNVRLIGDVAIVHARTTFTTADGAPSTGRYTDIWARRDGKWLAVAAHVSRK